MVEPQPSKLITRVRFPSPAPGNKKTQAILGFLFIKIMDSLFDFNL